MSLETKYPLKLEDDMSERPLTAMEEIKILHNQFLNVSDRIASHKKEQQEGFQRLQDSIDRIESVLIPRDGKPSIPEEIRLLKLYEEGRKKSTDTIIKVAIGSITMAVGTFIIWLVKILKTAVISG